MMAVVGCHVAIKINNLKKNVTNQLFSRYTISIILSHTKGLFRRGHFNVSRSKLLVFDSNFEI